MCTSFIRLIIDSTGLEKKKELIHSYCPMQSSNYSYKSKAFVETGVILKAIYRRFN
jgi:hypothetical protein